MSIRHAWVSHACMCSDGACSRGSPPVLCAADGRPAQSSQQRGCSSCTRSTSLVDTSAQARPAAWSGCVDAAAAATSTWQAVCFVRPTRDNVTALKRELRQPRFQSYHFCECRLPLVCLCTICSDSSSNSGFPRVEAATVLLALLATLKPRVRRSVRVSTRCAVPCCPLRRLQQPRQPDAPAGPGRG